MRSCWLKQSGLGPCRFRCSTDTLVQADLKSRAWQPGPNLTGPSYTCLGLPTVTEDVPGDFPNPTPNMTTLHTGYCLFRNRMNVLPTVSEFPMEQKFCLRPNSIEQIFQKGSQPGSEDFERWRIHHFPWELVPVVDRPRR
ncbi:unnamed protein product [Lepidochelys kempii]